jgi:hypothetical protein
MWLALRVAGGCLAPTLTVCDLVILIMGQLASFGLPCGEGPAAKLEAA